jgi:anti-anti-sigma regulatory factor/CheY-like chemotaxis protein
VSPEAAAREGAVQRRRILVIDDSPIIHEDFRKILTSTAADVELADMESMLFGAAQVSPAPDPLHFELEFAHQGAEGLLKVEQALSAGTPFCIVFVDVRMPLGWDGIETLGRIFAVEKSVQAVLCTAYSDYGWGDLRTRFGNTDRLLVLRKPLEAIEIAQLALSLTEKWHREPELARTTQALQKSEAQVRALLDAVPDILLRLDRDGRVLWQRMGRSSDGSADETALDRLCSPNQKSVLLTHLRDALKSGTTREVLLAADADDAGSHFHVNIAPLGDAEAIILLRDISMLRQAERHGAQQRAREMALEMKLEELAKLSTPLIPLREGVLVMPLVGEIDERRAHRLRETLLQSVSQRRAGVVILDLTGLPTLTAVVAAELTRTAQAARLLGAKMILSGLNAQAAQQVVM